MRTVKEESAPGPVLEVMVPGVFFFFLRKPRISNFGQASNVLTSVLKWDIHMAFDEDEARITIQLISHVYATNYLSHLLYISFWKVGRT